MIDSCSKISLPRLGSLIARNDYPIPLSFYKLSTDNHLEYQLNFEILYEVLSLTNRKLIVINELNSNNMLNLKEILLPGSACFATKFDFPRWDYVDVMLNEDCVIAHFNFWVNECKKVNRDLMNSFSAFSSLHIVSTTLSDYTSLEPCQELKDLFKLSSNLKNKTFFLIILRLDGEKFREINSIKSRLKELYVPELVELIEYETEFNSNEINYGEIDYGEKEKLNAFYNKFIRLLEKIQTRSMHSIIDIRNYYEKISVENQAEYFNNDTQLFDLEIDLRSPVDNSDSAGILKRFMSLVKTNEFFNIHLFDKCLANLRSELLTDLIKEKEEILKDLARLNRIIDQEIVGDVRSNFEIRYLDESNSLKAKESKFESQCFTMHKCWSLFYENYDSLTRLQKSEYLKAVSSLISYDYSLPLLTDNSLNITWKFLCDLFFYLDNLQKNEKVVVISIIGDARSAKTTLLNSLFGCNFECSQRTKGIQMSWISYKEKKIVVLDTEGLSGSNNEREFGNRLTSLIWLISHVILINSKSELSRNVEELICSAMSSKILLHKNNKHNPFVYFINRDQTIMDDVNTNVIENQLNRLKSSIYSNFSNNLSIELFLLPSSVNLKRHNIIDKKELRVLNNLFPDYLLKLRQKILNTIDSQEYNYSSFVNFYSNVCDYSNILKI